METTILPAWGWCEIYMNQCMRACLVIAEPRANVQLTWKDGSWSLERKGGLGMVPIPSGPEVPCAESAGEGGVSAGGQ